MSEEQGGVQKGKFSVFSGSRGGGAGASPWAGLEKALVLGNPIDSKWIGRQLGKATGLRVETLPGAKLFDSQTPSQWDWTQVSESLLKLASGEPSRLLIHPGTGSVARSAEFFRVTQSLGVRTVGPSPAAAQGVYNRLHFLLKAESLGIQNLVLHREPLSSWGELTHLMQSLRADKWVLKSIFQTGRASLLGFDRSSSDSQVFIEDQFSGWLSQMKLAGDEPLFFAERFYEGARKISVPFSRKSGPRGTGVEFYSTVDRSLQSKGRVRVEVSPAPALSSWVLDFLQNSTRKMAEAFEWTGVGSTEWLVDGVNCWLVDASLGLDSSAFLWGEVSQVCPIASQIRSQWSEDVLIEKSLDYPRSDSVRSAVLVNLHAEDPLLETPSQGEAFFASRGEDLERTLGEFRLGYQMDLSGNLGGAIKGEECALLGRAWVSGPDFSSCLDACSALLEDVWIVGTQKSSLSLVQTILAHPWVREWIVHSGFLENEFIPDYRQPELSRSFFLWVRKEVRKASGDSSVVEKALSLGKDSGLPSDVSIQFEPVFKVNRPSGTYDVLFGSLRQTSGPALPVAVVIRDRSQVHVQLGHWSGQFSVDPTTEAPGQVRLRSPSAGVLHRIRLGEESTFQLGEILGWLRVRDELLSIPAPFQGRVVRWEVDAGESVVSGDGLILLERIPLG